LITNLNEQLTSSSQFVDSLNKIAIHSGGEGIRLEPTDKIKDQVFFSELFGKLVDEAKTAFGEVNEQAKHACSNALKISTRLQRQIEILKDTPADKLSTTLDDFDFVNESIVEIESEMKENEKSFQKVRKMLEGLSDALSKVQEKTYPTELRSPMKNALRQVKDAEKYWRKNPIVPQLQKQTKIIFNFNLTPPANEKTKEEFLWDIVTLQKMTKFANMTLSEYTRITESLPADIKSYENDDVNNEGGRKKHLGILSQQTKKYEKDIANIQIRLEKELNDLIKSDGKM